MTQKFLFLSVLFATFTAAADVVIDWNNIALAAIRANNTSPPAAARNLAILHVSIYDAVNGIHRTHKPYFVMNPGPANTSLEAAAAGAAKRVLLTFYPAMEVTIETAFRKSLLGIPVEAAPERAAQWGDSVAVAILKRRSIDGSTASPAYSTGTQPGQWRPTVSFGGIVRPALLPGWGSVLPFALALGTQYRLPTPPTLTSSQYADELNLVKEIGGLVSAKRTSEQTQIAHFWGYGPGSATPPGHWNQIAQIVVEDHRNRRRHESKQSKLAENARLFALLNLAMADSAIVSWDAKYASNFWRPITAIQEADTDGNPATDSDPSWVPLLATPPFPEYTSGHSTFSGAGATVLAYCFGSDRIRFSADSDDLAGVQRSFASFSEAALESGISRIYGGIHFPSANLHGLSTGAAIGTYVAWNFLAPIDDHSKD